MKMKRYHMSRLFYRTNKIRTRWGQTSKRVLQLFLEIVRYYEDHQSFPTIRELMDRTEYTSTSATSYAINRLIDMGLLERDLLGSSRNISIVGGQWQRPESYTEIDNLLNSERS